MNLGTAVTFLAGLALLVGAAEVLVRGAAGLAVRAGLSAVVIGLTVVAFGTSAPELAVSTSNRNFEGRQGKGGRTFLASPLTAVATAITGQITDVRTMLD